MSLRSLVWLLSDLLLAVTLLTALLLPIGPPIVALSLCALLVALKIAAILKQWRQRNGGDGCGYDYQQVPADELDAIEKGIGGAVLFERRRTNSVPVWFGKDGRHEYTGAIVKDVVGAVRDALSHNGTTTTEILQSRRMSLMDDTIAEVTVNSRGQRRNVANSATSGSSSLAGYSQPKSNSSPPSADSSAPSSSPDSGKFSLPKPASKLNVNARPYVYTPNFLLSLRSRASDMSSILPAIPGVTVPPNLCTSSLTTKSNEAQKPKSRWQALLPRPTAPTFRLTTYNVLAELYCTPERYYWLTDNQRSWDTRRELILKEILETGGDVVCLQELTPETFSSYFAPSLHAVGYRGIFKAKNRPGLTSPDGTAMFYNTRKLVMKQSQAFGFADLVALLLPNLPAVFRLPHEQSDIDPDAIPKDLKADLLRFHNTLIVTTLALKDNHKQEIKVVTTHLHWNPADERTKILQACLLVMAVSNIKSEGKEATPIILAGDLNSTPTDRVLELLTKGATNVSSLNWSDKDYGILSHPPWFIPQTGMLKNPFWKLDSAYSTEDCDSVLSFTNHTPTFRDIIDHILVSQSLPVVSVLKGALAPQSPGLPNEEHPSDHIMIGAEFSFGEDTDKRRRRRARRGSEVDRDKEEGDGVYARQGRRWSEPALDVAGKRGRSQPARRNSHSKGKKEKEKERNRQSAHVGNSYCNGSGLYKGKPPPVPKNRPKDGTYKDGKSS
ncbi:Glucose-repressible alcohol dehydrogenase transcriptional effector [Gaertneriomyces sp. JEL0708]|nr:Glucose-repressible alcohol dehydrogenase transcriptional effector [Gaertneriomyces sp. JEL0708]